MKLRHRLLMFAALGPPTSFAAMTVEMLAITLVQMAFGLAHPVLPLGESVAMIAHNALSPALLIIFALFSGPAALSGLAVEMAERHELTDPAIAIAAAGAAVVLMSILPGFFTVLVYASPVGGAVAGLVAGAAAAFICWLIVPGRADPAPKPRPVTPVLHANRQGAASGFGRR